MGRGGAPRSALTHLISYELRGQFAAISSPDRGDAKRRRDRLVIGAGHGGSVRSVTATDRTLQVRRHIFSVPPLEGRGPWLVNRVRIVGLQRDVTWRGRAAVADVVIDADRQVADGEGRIVGLCDRVRDFPIAAVDAGRQHGVDSGCRERGRLTGWRRNTGRGGGRRGRRHVDDLRRWLQRGGWRRRRSARDEGDTQGARGNRSETPCPRTKHWAHGMAFSGWARHVRFGPSRETTVHRANSLW